MLWLFPDTTPETMLAIHAVTRKIAHLLEYALLGILAARAFRSSPREGLRERWFLVSLVLVVVYALSTSIISPSFPPAPVRFTTV